MTTKNFSVAWVLLFGLVTIGCKPSAPESAAKPPIAKAPVTGAVGELDSALARVQTSPNFDNYIGLGLAYTHANRTDRALEAFQKASSINPKAPLAYNNICSAYTALKKWKLGTENCEKALQIEPTFSLAKNNLAFLKKSQVQQATRMTDLEQNIKSGKEADKSRIDLGMEYYSQESYEKAAGLWKQIPENAPYYSIAQNDLATVCIITKKFDEAKTHLDKAVELEPKNTLYQNNRQWLATAKKEAGAQ